MFPVRASSTYTNTVLLWDTSPLGTLSLVEMLRSTPALIFDERQVSSLDELDTALKAQSWDLLVGDFEMFGPNPADVMTRIRIDQPQAAIILVSRHGTVRDAVDMMRLGARGFVEWTDPARLIDLVRQELEARYAAPLSIAPARCKNILDEQRELICRYDADFRLTFVNRSYSVWWGEPPEVLIGSVLTSRIPEADREQAVAHVKALNRDHPIITALHRTIKPDGTEHIIEWTDRALFDESGRFLEYQGVGRDVTEREHQAAQLKALTTDLERQRNQLGSLLDTMQEAIFAVSLPDRQLLYASACVDKILGRPLRWILDNPDYFRQIVHPDDYERAAEAMRTCLRDGYSELDLRIIWPDGQVRWLERQAWVNFDKTGHPIQIIDAARDITGRKQAEQTLQRYARRLEILHEIDLGLIQGASIPDLLNTTCMRLITLFECEEVGAFLIDPAAQEAILFGGISAVPAAIQDWKRVPLTPEIIGEFGTGRFKVVDDLQALPESYPIYQRARKLGMRSALRVRMTLDGQDIGVLVLNSTKPGLFTPEYQQIAMEISDQMAIAIHQKQLTDALAQSSAELEHRVIARTAELKSANDRVNVILNNSHDGILLVDQDLNILQSNPAFDQLLPAFSVEQGRRNLLAYFDADNAARLRQHTKKVLADQTTTHLDVIANYQDGTPVEMELGLGYVPGGSLVVAVHDITERKQIERQLRYHASVQENMSDAVIVSDMDLRIRSWNKAAERIYGWRESEVLGRLASEIVRSEFSSPEERQQVLEKLLSIGWWQAELSQHRKDGSVIYVLGSVTVVHDEHGQALGIIAVNRDITTRKQTEIALAESEARYRLLAENIEDIIMTFSMDRRITYFSPSSQRLLGYLPEEVVGTFHSDYIHPDDYPQVVDRTRQAVVAHESAYTNIFRLRHKAGHYIWYEVHTTILRESETDSVINFISVLRDITDRKHAENELLDRMTAEQAFEASLKTLHEITLELTPIADLDTFYRCVVEWGTARLGFDRLGLFLYDDATGAAIGTYGTDAQGHVCDEHHMRFVPGPDGIMGRAIRSSDRFFLEDNTGLRGSSAEFVGAGWNAAVILWNGSQSLGWLTADNLIRQKPVSMQILNLLSLYALTVGNLLAEKQTSHALQQSEARYRQLFENTAATKLLIDRHTGDIVDANSAASEYYGYPLEVLKTMNIRHINVLPVEDIGRNIETAWRREQGIFEARHRLANGSIRDVDSFTGPLALQGQEFVFSIVVDVTERKQAEEALKASEAKFRLLVETMRSGLIMGDEEDRVTYVNDRLCEMIGYTRDDLLGTNIYDYVDAENAAIIHQQAKRRRQAEGSPYELTIKHRGGHEINVLVSDTPLFDNQQRAAGTVVVLTDISVQKQAEKALQQALQEEKMLGELKSRFVSMTSHEFRNPLAAILASTETLVEYRDRMESSKIDLRLDKIRQQVKHLNSIVDDVLNLSRMQSGNIEFKPALGDLSALCKQVVDDFESQAAHQGRVIYTCPSSPIIIFHDGRLLRQTITNLVSNGLKYAPVDTPVHLTLMTEAEQVVLTVEDQGIGIPAEDLKRLFEPFHRASNVGSISGTGLGLSIAKQAVELHNGTLTVESRVGIGTTFTICIPTQVVY